MQMKLLARFLILTLAFCLFGCDIYTSSDRKKFEDDHVTASAQGLMTGLKNKTLISCSIQSLSTVAERTREVGTYADSESSTVYILRQHLIRGTWISEIDNLNGAFCLYE